MKPTAAIYCRISLDKSKEGAGVERQEREARKLARAKGLQVVSVHIDNERSAYSGKPRPEWRSMLDAIQRGEVVNVVAWANDRLYRRVRDQLELLEVVGSAGGKILTVADGELDPTSAEGRMRSGILASVAEFESARKAERVQAASATRAEKGRPHGPPPWGWRRNPDDPMGPWIEDPEPAGLLREAIARVLRGESVYAIAADWNGRGVLTAGSAEAWRHQALRKIIRRPTNAGLREHRGEVIGQGNWPAIVPETDWREAVSRLKAPRAQAQGRSYLLTGRLRCAACGSPMYGHRMKIRTYVCRNRACLLRIPSEKLDGYIVDQVLGYFSKARARKVEASRRDPERRSALRELDAATMRMDEIAELFAEGEMDKAAFRRAQAVAIKRRRKAEGALVGQGASRAIADALASPGGVRSVFDAQGIAWQRELVAAIVDEIRVGSGRGFSSNRVSIAWR